MKILDVKTVGLVQEQQQQYCGFLKCKWGGNVGNNEDDGKEADERDMRHKVGQTGEKLSQMTAVFRGRDRCISPGSISYP